MGFIPFTLLQYIYTVVCICNQYIREKMSISEWTHLGPLPCLMDCGFVSRIKYCLTQNNQRLQTPPIAKTSWYAQIPRFAHTLLVLGRTINEGSREYKSPTPIKLLHVLNKLQYGFNSPTPNKL